MGNKNKIKLNFKNAKDRNLWHNSTETKKFTINENSYVRQTVLRRGIGKCSKYRIWLIQDNVVTPIYKSTTDYRHTVHPQGYTYIKSERCGILDKWVMNTYYVPYVDYNNHILLGRTECLKQHPTSHHLVVIVNILREYTSLTEKISPKDSMRQYLRFYREDNFETPISELRIDIDSKTTIKEWVKLENTKQYE